MKRRAKWIGIGLLLITVAIAVYIVPSRWAIWKAESQLSRGFAALAADTLDSHRYLLHRRENDCKVMIAAYYNVQNREKLMWAAEACYDSKIDIPQVYSGLASAREFMGQDIEALKILLLASKKYNSTPEIFYHLAKLYRRKQRDEEAIEAFQKAFEVSSGDSKLGMEVLAYFSLLKRWPEAGKIADKLREYKTEDPEEKLIIARAFLNSGDKPAALRALNDAHMLIGKYNATLRDDFKKIYPDLLSIDPTTGEKVGGR